MITLTVSKRKNFSEMQWRGSEATPIGSEESGFGNPFYERVKYLCISKRFLDKKGLDMAY